MDHHELIANHYGNPDGPKKIAHQYGIFVNHYWDSCEMLSYVHRESKCDSCGIMIVETNCELVWGGYD